MSTPYEPTDHSKCDHCHLDHPHEESCYTFASTCRCCLGCMERDAGWTLRVLGDTSETPGEPYCKGCLPEHEVPGVEARPMPRVGGGLSGDADRFNGLLQRVAERQRAYDAAVADAKARGDARAERVRCAAVLRGEIRSWQR